MRLVSAAACRKLGAHKVKRHDHQQEEEDVRDSKHPRWEIIKNELVKPMGDKTVVVQLSGAITFPKSILPDGQGAHDTEDALGCDNSHQ